MEQPAEPQTLSDEAIAAKIQQGQQELFSELLARYEAKILRYTKKFLKEAKDSEDIVQDVFIKTYRNIQSFDTSRKFSSWLYRIAHNECINFLKKKQVESVPMFDLDVFFPHIAHQEHTDEVNNQELKEILESSLKKLDVKYREPLVLCYIEGFDYKEIADILHIPVATVGVRLTRGKRLLLQEYSKQDGVTQ